ncbi:hypothetical protein HK097_003398 [Rhizophlyctis rosea]|uniref:Cytochrome P450 n=1 Tax=Rhizophlyctis rosea TaxID=64517 RepID=A0AAD5SL85_9FUNG|nr:hypothetical protein HK097_003398 [Rhizophlyctis rosea]
MTTMSKLLSDLIPSDLTGLMDNQYTRYALGAGAVACLAIPAYTFIKNRIDPISLAVIRGRFNTKDIVEERYRRGAIHWTWSIFGGLYVIIGEHPAKWLLIQEKDNIWSGIDGRPKAFRGFATGSIIDQDFEEHARSRRLMVPAFKIDALKGYLPRMLHHTTNSMEHWAKECDKGGYVDLEEGLKLLTLRIAFTLLLGAKIPDDNFEEMSRLRERYAELFLGFAPWPIGPWDGKKRSKIAKDSILKDVGEIINERRKDLEEREKSGKGTEDGVVEDSDPLWLLLKAVDENGDRLSVQELAAHSLILVIAGHETTAATLSSFVAECIRDPTLISRLRAEQDALIASTGRQIPSYEDLKNMPFMDAVFRECERVHSAAPNIIRRARKDIVYVPKDGTKPTVVKKGTMILWDVLSTNRDPSIYPDPHTFNPDRWLHQPPTTSPTDSATTTSDIGTTSTSIPSLSPFRLATFSAGHRICIGMQFARMEMLAVASRLVREYDFTSDVREGTVLEKTISGRKPLLHYPLGLGVRFLKRTGVQKAV